MATPALDACQTLLGDVNFLWSKHPKAADPGVGRPRTDEGPLNRACVALLYTAWEVYVEDSVIWLAEHAAEVSGPDRLPAALRIFLGKTAKENPWSLAADGWRAALVAAVRARSRGDEDTGRGGLNSAGPSQVARLHQELLGESLLAQVRWRGKTNDAVCRDLESLVRVRGSIVHRGETPGDLSLRGVRQWHDFVRRAAEQLDGHIATWATTRLSDPV